MKRDLHVVVLPWSAFGHIMPFFQLSIALARNGVRVSFVSTPRNIQRLPKLPSDVNSLVDLVALPMPRLGHGLLPEGAEATVDIPFEKLHHLKAAYDMLKHPFKDLVTGKSPDWIIIDFISDWAIEIAREVGIPVAFFSVLSAAAQVFVGPPDLYSGDNMKRLRPSPESLTTPAPWVDFPSTVALRGFESYVFYAVFYGESSSGAKVIQSSDVVAFRSCPEYEGQYLDTYQRLIHKKVIPVGLLPPDKPKKNVDTPVDQETAWTKSFQWLESQKPKSVVFVGFGSECKLTKEQVHELAYGLELSGLPFLWALRKPAWAAHDGEALPDGFVDRTCGRGIVCMGWVPQMEILAHPSVGGSLFHSGWGSVIETLQFGHCLVVLPLIIDQPLNARLLVERELAVEVERSEDGSFTREGISDALRLAMVSEEGRKLRDNAREAAKVFGDHELHREYAAKFVEYLKNNVSKMSEE